jgi:hypothetical protein
VTELDPGLVDRALSVATKRSANLDYFFDKLSSADWIEPLRDRGLFSDPPEQFVDEQGYVHAPGWSASRYLARVAAAAPSDVVAVISSIFTNSERVHEDFAEAALRMPMHQAQALAVAETAWLVDQSYLYYALPDKLVALAAKLAVDSAIDAADALIRALFALQPLANADSGGSKPRAKFSAWDYDRLLGEVITQILPHAPERMLATLRSLLGDAMDILRDGASDAGFDALSRLWRPRVGQASSRSEVQETLVSAVRDAAMEVRTQRLLADETTVRILTPGGEELPRRIAMYVLAHQPEPDISLIRGWLLDATEFTSDEPSVEYRILLSKNASRLVPDDLRVLLDLVERGPDLAEYRARAERYGLDVSEAEVADHVAWWQAARLKLLSSSLDREWAERLRELQAQVGDAELPTSGVVVTSWGPTSPLSADELAAMTDPELLGTLRDWRQGDSWMAPSVEGLGQAVGQLARQDPARMTGLLREFQALRVEYIEYALRGLRESLDDGASFPWEPVVGFIHWLVDQRSDPTEISDRESETAPRLARRGAMFLLEAGLRLEERGPSTALRSSVWHAISQVATDPEPSPEYEERYGGSNMDPVTLSLNTTRPSAIRASIAYAVWLQRITASNNLEAVETGWLTTGVPEVGDLLDECLRHDPSTSVRAVVGLHFTNIYALDRAWATSHVATLFPNEDTPLREAAWGSYVIYSAPYNDLLHALRPTYERSAELAGSPGHSFRWLNGDPRSRMGDHIMIFYWRGLLELDDPLLATFWQRAPSQVRTDALTSVGRAVSEDRELPDEQQERVAALWKFAVENRAQGDGSELGAFAWWFPSAALPAAWRLEELIELLDQGVRPDPGFLVTRELPSVAGVEPLLAMRALRSLLELERAGWTISTSTDDIAGALTAALASEDRKARDLAVETVHWLGAIGYRDFRALLSA